MGNERLGTRLGFPANEAVRLLLHHVHGGLHNAAMSLALAGEDGQDGRVAADDAPLVAQSGLEGIAQAARGVSLLTVLLGLSAGPAHAPADRQWVALVEKLLRHRAAERGVAIEVEADLAPLDAEALVVALMDGIELIDTAPTGATVRLPRTSAVAT